MLTHLQGSAATDTLPDRSDETDSKTEGPVNMPNPVQRVGFFQKRNFSGKKFLFVLTNAVLFGIIIVSLRNLNGTFEFFQENDMEMLEVKTVREPLYNRLRTQLLEYIESENLRMLPTERELMARYKVSRNTLRRAVKELTEEKVLQPIQGLGTLVYPVPEITENSRILVLCDYKSQPFQNETFNTLLFMLNNSRLNSMVMMVNHDHPDIARFEEVLKGCDGVIVDWFCSYIDALLEIVVRSGKKIVCLRWRPLNGLPYVAEDIAAGFHHVADHLLDLGHTRIAYLGTEDQLRLGGIRRAFAERGVTPDPRLFLYFSDDSHVRSKGFDGVEELLRRGNDFTAIIGANDEIALGIQERLLIEGMRIPEDVSVTGFDNLNGSASYPVPLTTCCGDTEGMIREAIAYLFSSRKSGMTLNTVVNPRLIIRNSTVRNTK